MSLKRSGRPVPFRNHPLALKVFAKAERRYYTNTRQGSHERRFALQLQLSLTRLVKFDGQTLLLMPGPGPRGRRATRCFPLLLLLLLLYYCPV